MTKTSTGNSTHFRKSDSMAALLSGSRHSTTTLRPSTHPNSLSLAMIVSFHTGVVA